jgi:lipid-A-disaccharide synthase
MRAAGVDLWADQENLAVGGIFEIATSLPRVVATWHKMLRCLRETDPDVVVLVDSGGFNLPFAKRIRTISRAKILYYLAPQVWAWREKRLRRLAERVDRIAVILPFEPAFYAERGVEVDFVGHPAVDALAADEREEEVSFRSGGGSAFSRARGQLGIKAGDSVLGLFPGSRRNELERHLPIQLETFLRLRACEPRFRALQAVVGLTPNLDRAQALAMVHKICAAAQDAVRVVTAEGASLLNACDVALAKPGTITVELMLRAVPMVVMGQVNRASAMIARRSLKIDWLSMPNLIAQEQIVPELFQDAATPDRICAALAPLFSGEARDCQVKALRRASQSLGSPGAADRTAAIVEELLGTRPA